MTVAFTSTASSGSRAIGRVGHVRAVSLAFLSTFVSLWFVRTTGTLSPMGFGVILGCVGVSIMYGDLFVRATSRLCGWHPGLAYELLVGFFVGNTMLFVLTLVSPLGVGLNSAIVALTALGCSFAARSRLPAARRELHNELASLACIVFVGIAATLWVSDQQPIVSSRDGLSIFTVWLDVFVHVREISAFAQGHGLGSISDIKLAGIGAQAYHFASYMVPAALDALTPISALDSYAAFQLPFGLLLLGLAAYALPAIVFRTTWPAVVASAVLIASPDAYQQGFGIRYLSFHFMSQANLGMLYGIACISLAWIFMVEATRNARVTGLVVAYAFLAIALSYKAHVFVANALILMLYPCLFFGRFRWRWRIFAAVGVVVLFCVVVSLSQRVPRVPTLRLDFSGLGPYVRILLGGFADGRPKEFFEWLYAGHLPHIANALLGGSLILFGSFGAWTVVAPAVLWTVRRQTDRRAVAVLLLVVLNYMVMSLGLALDERGVGSPEEFLNRPHAWAWFLVVVFVTTIAAREGWRRHPVATRRAVGGGVLAAAALLGIVNVESRGLETFPEWDGYATFAQFNAAPTCLVRSARFLRDHASTGDVVQDSSLDPGLVVTALAERQDFVARAGFGGNAEVVAQRAAGVERVQAAADPAMLKAWAKAHGVAWYLMRPDDSARWMPQFLQQSAFRCGDFRVFRLDS